MSAAVPLDSLGRRRSPAAVPGYLAGRPPRSKGRRYPADPPRTEEIVAVMRCCGERPHGLRARGLIVVPWRAGLRIQEALDLTELDLDPRRGSVLVRRGKGGHRREVGMDGWGLRTARALAAGPPLHARRSAVLRDQRSHVRSRVAAVRSTRRPEAASGACGRAPPV